MKKKIKAIEQENVKLREQVKALQEHNLRLMHLLRSVVDISSKQAKEWAEYGEKMMQEVIF